MKPPDDPRSQPSHSDPWFMRRAILMMVASGVLHFAGYACAVACVLSWSGSHVTSIAFAAAGSLAIIVGDVCSFFGAVYLEEAFSEDGSK